MATRFETLQEFRSWLLQKNEQELRNKLYKALGNGARLNGNKSELITRLTETAVGFSGEKERVVFPELYRRPRSTVPSGARPAPSASGGLPRPRPPQLTQNPSAGPPVQRIRRAQAPPLTETPQQVLFRRTLEAQAGLIIQEISQLASPRPRRMSVNSPSPALLTPRRRPRAASASSSERRGPEVQLREQNSPGIDLDCKICFDNKINTVLLPCGHACCCQECAIRVKFSTWEV